MAILSRHISASETCLGSYPYILDISCMDPKGHIGISQISFRFLWADTDEKRPLVLASKKKDISSKDLWRMGLKKHTSLCIGISNQKCLGDHLKIWTLDPHCKRKIFPPRHICRLDKTDAEDIQERINHLESHH